MMNHLRQLRELGHNLTVLYSEDNEDLRRTFASYLRKFFGIVKECVNGYEALEEYKKNRYDIIVTDITMPILDGLSMAKEIKAINETQNIIIISAHSDVKNYIESIKIGIDGYILKPIDYEQVNQTLLKVTNKVNQIKDNENYQKNLEQIVAQKTEEIRNQYISDNLTKLYNRIYLDEIIKNGTFQTALLLNIDNFRLINEGYGFEVGDSVLKEIAKVLNSFLKDKLHLFRLDSDEFFYLLEYENLEEIVALANSIKNYFDTNSIVVSDIQINISFTMSIDSGIAKELLRHTSVGIKQIREIGKNRIHIYKSHQSYEEIQKENIFWIVKVKEVLNSDKMEAFFQPILNLKTNEINKYESLARIITDHEIVAPKYFLKPAKIAGLISEITKIIIDKAFCAIKGSDKVISINIVEQDLKEDFLIAYLEKKREEYKLNANQIILEILESVSTSETFDALEQLQELKTLGYKIAIDDFGTENSNFSRLLALNVDFIKIDGSFIKNLDTDENAQKIVKSIVSFAHSINSLVIAEFVHNKEILQKVKEYGIDFAQGYAIGEAKEKFLG